MGGFEIGVVVGVLILAAVLLDAFIRSRSENKNPYRLSINKKKAKDKEGNFAEEDGFTSELPNGGARVISRDEKLAKKTANKKVEQSDSTDDDAAIGISLESGMAATDDSDPFDDLASLVTGLDDKEDPMEAVNRMLAEKPEPLPKNQEASKTKSPQDSPITADAKKPAVKAKVDTKNKDTKEAKKTAAGAKENDAVAQGDLLEELNVDDEPPSKAPEEVLILHVMSTAGGFKGGPLLQILRACDLRFGDMNIFHRYEEANGNGAVQFGVANMVKPGTFDINAMDTFKTPGITLFLPLPGPKQALKAYDYMVETAQCVAKNLHGELKDESLSVVTEQTLEHGRQRVRDFERQRLSSKDS